jgi:hypothetical protein
MELPAQARDIFAQGMIAKFLATRDADGGVNAAVVITLQPSPDDRRDRLIFGEWLMWKSRDNLKARPEVAAAAVDLKLKMVTLTGDFVGFEATGLYVDTLNSSDFLKYNAYTGVRSAGAVDVREVGGMEHASYPRVAADLAALQLRRLLARGNGKAERIIHRTVEQQFVAPNSLKALAVMGPDGYPRIFPTLAVAGLGGDAFLIRISPYNRGLRDLALPARAAMCVLTMQAVSFQVKGELERDGDSYLRFKVSEVWNSSPPLAGDRIYPPQE